MTRKTIGAIIAAALVGGFGSRFVASATGSSTFSRAARNAGQGNNTGKNSRSSQLEALRESGLISTGTLREGVRALLGDPENINGLRELYSLGIGYGGSLEYFSVQYDEGGRVARTSIVRG